MVEAHSGSVEDVPSFGLLLAWISEPVLPESDMLNNFAGVLGNLLFLIFVYAKITSISFTIPKDSGVGQQQMLAQALALDTNKSVRYFYSCCGSQIRRGSDSCLCFTFSRRSVLFTVWCIKTPSWDDLGLVWRAQTTTLSLPAAITKNKE
jgi:hypothetical protein